MNHAALEAGTTVQVIGGKHAGSFGVVRAGDSGGAMVTLYIWRECLPARPGVWAKIWNKVGRQNVVPSFHTLPGDR